MSTASKSVSGPESLSPEGDVAKGDTFRGARRHRNFQRRPAVENGEIGKSPCSDSAVQKPTDGPLRHSPEEQARADVYRLLAALLAGPPREEPMGLLRGIVPEGPLAEVWGGGGTDRPRPTRGRVSCPLHRPRAGRAGPLQLLVPGPVPDGKAVGNPARGPRAAGLCASRWDLRAGGPCGCPVRGDEDHALRTRSPLHGLQALLRDPRRLLDGELLRGPGTGGSRALLPGGGSVGREFIAIEQTYYAMPA